jgi:hypothetical protein
MSLAYDKGPVASCCEHGNEISIYAIYQEFLYFSAQINLFIYLVNLPEFQSVF